MVTNQICVILGHKTEWKMGGRWEVTTNVAFAPHISDTPPAECHDIAKKKKILEETQENEVSQ
jgi:hypothetical protein